MSRLFQIGCIVCLSCIGLTTGAPIFQGIKVQRGFEIEFKPFTFKPISFFKEKWSPFGRFGARRGIARRDLSTKVLQENPPPPLLPPAPVHEVLEEVSPQPINPLQTPVRELTPGPDPVNPGLANLIRIPVRDTFNSLYTNIRPVPPVNSNLIERPSEVFVNGMQGELPPRPIGPVPPQAPVPVNVVPLITSPPPIPVAPVSVPLPEIPPTEGPLVKGKRFALYLGNALVKMVSQFLANAKLQLSQLSTPVPNPPPPASVPPLPPVPVMPLGN